MEIYPAREAPIAGINAEALLAKMKLKESQSVARGDLSERIKQFIKGPTVVMTLGAGDRDKEVDTVKKTIVEIDRRIR